MRKKTLKTEIIKFPSMMSEDKWTNLAICFLEHEHEITHKLTNIIHYCHEPTCGNMIYFPFKKYINVNIFLM